MKKFKKILKLTAFMILMVSSFSFCFLGCKKTTTETATARAEEVEQTQDTTTDTKTIEDFLALLKSKYGADYQAEYDKIIEKWGSIENYLLSLADSDIVPDKAKNGWTSFVNWLDEYKAIWGGGLAFFFFAIYLIKKAKDKQQIQNLTNKVKEQAEKLSKLIESQNIQHDSDIAIAKSLLLTLPANEQSNEARQSLTNAIAEAEKEV